MNKFTFLDCLQIALLPITTGVLIWNKVSIPSAILLGFLSTFIPIVPGAIHKGFLAFKKEWNDPKWK